MTRNPLHFEQSVLKHVVPGIDDRESHLYKEFDSKGRADQSFYQRAALAGIKNLETTSFRKDSPIQQTQGRFPEKYIKAAKTASHAVTNYSSRKPSWERTSCQNQGAAESRNSPALNQGYGNFTNLGRIAELADSPEANTQRMTRGEQQLILEAAFSAVCDNIMSNQMHGNSDSWLQLSIDDKLL